MSLRSDILWIQNEISKVKDPELLEEFKRLLLMRKNYSSQTLAEYNRDIELSEKDITEGRVYRTTQVKDLKDAWKKTL